VLGIWEALQIRSDLSHQEVESLSAHSIDVLTALHLLLKWPEVSFNLCFQAANRTILDRESVRGVLATKSDGVLVLLLSRLRSPALAWLSHLDA
jgi:hypothetical protein